MWMAGCGLQGQDCYKFYASFLELSMYFKHTPILHNHIEADESLQLFPLAPTLDSDRRLGVHAPASCHGSHSQWGKKNLSKASQDLVSWDMPPNKSPDAQPGTPLNHSTKSGLGEVLPVLQGCLFIHTDDLGQLSFVEFFSLTLSNS